MTEKHVRTVRLESDSIGTLEIPGNAYYGVQSLRAQRNFPITGHRMNSVFIKNMALIKHAAAVVNSEGGRLPEEKALAIEKACDEIAEGKLADSFIVDGIQGGAGTSANMNMNEVAANRAIEILGGTKGDYSVIHPNDDVNMCQSTNDVIPLRRLVLEEGLMDEDTLARALDAERLTGTRLTGSAVFPDFGKQRIDILSRRAE